MSSVMKHIRQLPKYIANGLLIHKFLQFLKSIGFVVEPFYLIQEGAFGIGEIDFGNNFKNYDFKELEPEDMKPLESLSSGELKENGLSERFAQGHICFALKHEGTIAAFMWCNPNGIQFEPCRRILAHNEAYLYGAHTLQKFRGRNLAPYLRSKCYEALKAQGRDVLYSYSDYFNRSAVRFKQKLAARFLFIGIYLNLFGLFKKNWIIRRLAKESRFW